VALVKVVEVDAHVLNETRVHISSGKCYIYNTNTTTVQQSLT